MKTRVQIQSMIQELRQEHEAIVKAFEDSGEEVPLRSDSLMFITAQIEALESVIND